MSQLRMITYAKDEGSHTHLMCAALDGQTEIVKALLQKGADVNERNREGRTALMFAVINLHSATVKTLLSFGANVNAQAADGCTPLMLAACSGDAEITRALLNSGADVRKILTPGKTASVLAVEHGYYAIVELLKRALVQSADVRPQNFRNGTDKRQESPGRSVRDPLNERQ